MQIIQKTKKTFKIIKRRFFMGPESNNKEKEHDNLVIYHRNMS